VTSADNMAVDTDVLAAGVRPPMVRRSPLRYMASMPALPPLRVLFATVALVIALPAAAAERDIRCAATIDGLPKGEASFRLDLEQAALVASGQRYSLTVTTTRVAWDYTVPTPNGKALVREVGSIDRIGGTLQVTRSISQDGRLVDRSEIVGTCTGMV
jgi:hypothetical protein